MEPLSGLQQLRLDNNPWSKNFEDQDSYVSEVKKVFPKLLKLDDIDLPPPIVFDLEETVTLPKPQGKLFLRLCSIEKKLSPYLSHEANN